MLSGVSKEGRDTLLASGSRGDYHGGMTTPIVTLSSLLLLAACGSAAGGERRTLPAGTWGGDHIRLEVTTEGAAVELDCAHGAISGPIQVDGKGRFDAAGTFVREHGGPVREGEEDSQPARYTGRVQGGTMTLTITVADGATHGPYELNRGRTPRLTKCL